MSASVYLHIDPNSRAEVVSVGGHQPFVLVTTQDLSIHFAGTGPENLRHARDFAMAILGALVNHGGGLPEPLRDPSPIEPPPAPALQEIPL